MQHIADEEEFTPTERIAISIANDDYSELREVEGYERFDDNPYPILNAVKFVLHSSLLSFSSL